MPRKINYDDHDYGDDYEDYSDYDYDYDYDAEEKTRDAPESKQEIVKPNVWSCSICTYDNEESMSVCNICGVLRTPLVNFSVNNNNNNKTVNNNNSNKTVGGICKDSGASIMAKSLFASLPHRTPKKAIVVQQQNDGLVTEEGNNFHQLRSIQGNFHKFHEAFSSQGHSKINIATFKFDVPSPDDLVSNGLRSSKMGSRGHFVDLRSSGVSSSISEKNGAVNTKSSGKKSDRVNSLLPKGKQDSLDENYSSTNEAVQSSTRSTDKSSSVMGKDRPGIVDEGSCSNDGGVNLHSSDVRSDSSYALMLEDRYVAAGDSTGSSVDGVEPHNHTGNLTNNVKNMSLTVKSGSSTNVSARRMSSFTEYKPEKWMLPDKTGDGLTQLNLAIVGHVDSGKSTLSGRLLFLLGRISQKQMHKYEKEAKLQGKGSFAYAWALDESAEERERGITMTVAVAYFDTKKYHVVVLDSPGHKDFVPNMISGATQSDAGVLVIDASIGSFEVGMDSTKGQTREHAQLVRSFGVDQVIVAVNKMDVVQYSKDRFDSIKQQLGTFLRSCGFKDSSVTWIPLSAMENQNLVTAPDDTQLLSWYQGPCLLDAIDSLQPPSRDFSKPLIMPICDVVKLQHGHVSACGKLEAGALRSGLKVLVMPSGEVGTVHSIERDSQSCSIARAGDNIAVSLHGIDISNVMSGGVLCHPDFPVAIASHLELKVLVLAFAPPILIGSQLECHIHHTKEAARVVKILSVLDTKTGMVIKKKPRCLTAKQSAVVEVALQGPVCVEEFSNCRALGRVFLRALGRTIAVGIITRMIEDGH